MGLFSLHTLLVDDNWTFQLSSYEKIKRLLFHVNFTESYALFLYCPCGMMAITEWYTLYLSLSFQKRKTIALLRTAC